MCIIKYALDWYQKCFIKHIFFIYDISYLQRKQSRVFIAWIIVGLDWLQIQHMFPYTVNILNSLDIEKFDGKLGIE